MIDNVAKNMKRILAILPATKPEMEIRLGITRSSIYRAFQRMDELKDYHVGGWVQSSQGSPTAIFHKGPGKNVSCPEMVPKDRRSTPRKNAPVFRHWMDIALFGHGPARSLTEEEE